jgi:hypothetical protein
MSAPQYIGLIAALLWAGSCSEDNAGKSAVSEWLAVGLAIIAIVLAIALTF